MGASLTGSLALVNNRSQESERHRHAARKWKPSRPDRIAGRRVIRGEMRHRQTARAEGPEFALARVVAMENGRRQDRIRLNGPTIRPIAIERLARWAEEILGYLPRPQGGALGWENRAPSGRTKPLASRSLFQLSGFFATSYLDLMAVTLLLWEHGIL